MISAFASLIGMSLGIMSSAIGLKICAKPTRMRKYESTIKKKKKNHDKVLLLAKYKLNSIEDLISNFLIDSNINHDLF